MWSSTSRDISISGPTRVLRSFQPGSRGNRHPTGTEMPEYHLAKWSRRETGAGDDDIDLTAKTSDIGLFYPTIAQTQDPEGSSHQIDPTTRPVDESHLDCRGGGWQGVSRGDRHHSPDPRSTLRHRIWLANNTESARCRVSTRSTSAGPIPPAETASVISQSRKRSNRSRLLRGEDMTRVFDGTS